MKAVKKMKNYIKEYDGRMNKRNRDGWMDGWMNEMSKNEWRKDWGYHIVLSIIQLLLFLEPTLSIYQEYSSAESKNT